MASQHSQDFRRRLAKLPPGQLTTQKDTLSPEERLSKEQLEHLHNCIRFTQTVMSEEAKKRWEK